MSVRYDIRKPPSPIPQLLCDAPEWSSFHPSILKYTAFYLNYEGGVRPSDVDNRRAYTALATLAIK